MPDDGRIPGSHAPPLHRDTGSSLPADRAAQRALHRLGKAGLNAPQGEYWLSSTPQGARFPFPMEIILRLIDGLEKE